VDFVVNTLDEALRVLKNEIRQHRPLGVGLIAEVGSVLEEMAERGVLPDLQVSIDGRTGRPGGPQLHLERCDGLVVATSNLRNWLLQQGWTEAVVGSDAERSLRVVDAELLAALPAEDTVRRTWLQRISHYQRSTAGGSRLTWLPPAELV
jgi:hypothetical protein